jgi:hypothetical protein
METVRNEGVPEIQFVIAKRETNALSNAAFVYLLQQRFDGEIYECTSYVEAKRRRIFLRMRFDAFSMFGDAWAHCRQHLSPEGDVKPDYLGAVRKADPSLSMATGIMERALGNPAP